MRKLRVLAFAALVAIALIPSHVAAQAESGSLVGNLTDPSGAVVPGAQITIKNIATNAVRMTSSDERGNYVVANLQPAVYDVMVEAAGFAANTKRVQITVGSRTTLNFALTVGAAVSTIEVTSEAGVQVNLETQTLGSVIDSKKISELPNLTRNPYNLATIAGNVSEDDPTGRGVGVAINGQRAASTSILLDGATNSDEFRATVGQAIPLDAVQEFSVLTSNFTAEFGRAGGGIVNVATKAGTNDIHGTAYLFGRYSALASNSFFRNAQGIERPVFTRNQFGYSVGGPILKDKLHFFQSTEWTRVRSGTSTTAVIPTAQLLALTNANTQNFYNMYGARKSNLQVLATYSKATATTLNDSAGTTICPATGNCAAIPVGTAMFDRVQYFRPGDSGGGAPQNSYSLIGRIDWNLGADTQIYGRYALESQGFLEGSGAHSPFEGFDTGNTAYNNHFVVSMTHTFSPRVVSQSKLVYNRQNGLNPLGQFPNTPTLFFRTSSTRIDGFLTAHPGYLPFNPGTGIPFGGPQNFIQAYEDIGWTRGAHQFRFGGSYVYLQDNRTFGAYANPSLTLGSSLSGAMENFVNGVLLSFASAINPQGRFPCRFPLIAGQPCGVDANNDLMITGSEVDTTGTVTLPVGQPSFSRSNRYHEFGFYGQDSWRVTPRITLNLGMRWEYYGVQHNKDPNLDANYYDATGGSIFQQIRSGGVSIVPLSPIKGLWKKDWNNFAPRVGFAWDMFGNGKTSLRGGWGIGYERNFGNVTFNVIQNPPNYAVTALTAGVDIATLPISTDIAGPLAGSTGAVALPPVSLRNVNSNIVNAYAQFFSLAIEHEVLPKLFTAIEYSGSKGDKLYSLEDPNRPGAGNVYLGMSCRGSSPTSTAYCFDRLTHFDVTQSGVATRNSQYTGLNRRGNGGFSNHNSLNVRVQGSNFGGTGLTFTFNYTWAHTFDNTSSTFSESGNDFNLGLLDPFNPKLDYGSANFDIRHRMSISGIWDIPYARNIENGVLRRILDGWTVAPVFTARTGNPFTIWDCTDARFAVCGRLVQTGSVSRSSAKNPAGSGAPAGFNLINVAGSSIGRYRHPLTNNVEFGPYPANMTARNFFRSPGSWNVDVGIYKTTKITERLSLQFRAEMFNTFNHANLTVLGSSAEIVSAPTPSTGLVPDQTIEGRKDGNRQVQLALKLIF